jgi:hypothetical protein
MTTPMQPNRNQTSDTEHDFILKLIGVPDVNQSVEDALFEAGCDDALLGRQGDLISLCFSRDGATREAAIQSAMADVRRAGFDAEVLAEVAQVGSGDATR